MCYVKRNIKKTMALQRRVLKALYLSPNEQSIGKDQLNDGKSYVHTFYMNHEAEM